MDTTSPTRPSATPSNALSQAATEAPTDHIAPKEQDQPGSPPANAAPKNNANADKPKTQEAEEPPTPKKEEHKQVGNFTVGKSKIE